MKRLPYISATLILAALLILVMCSFFVRITETAVLTMLGTPVSEITEPGFYWKWPYPVQKVYKLDKRIQNYEGVLDETYTGDSRIILIKLFCGWRIEKPITFLERVGTMEEANRQLDGLVRNAKNAVVGKHPLSHLVSAQPGGVKFKEMEQEMLSMIQAEAIKRLGIDIVFLGIKQLGLPESITEKVFDRMIKERERISESYLSEGKAAASQIKAEADKEKELILSKARAEAKRIMGEGEAKAQEAFTIFNENVDLALFLKKMETLENTLNENTTLILDFRTPPYDLLMGIDGAAGNSKGKTDNHG